MFGAGIKVTYFAHSIEFGFNPLPNKFLKSVSFLLFYIVAVNYVSSVMRKRML